MRQRRRAARKGGLLGQLPQWGTGASPQQGTLVTSVGHTSEFSHQRSVRSGVFIQSSVEGCLRKGLHLRVACNRGGQRSPEGTWRKPLHKGMQILAAGSELGLSEVGSLWDMDHAGQCFSWFFLLFAQYTPVPIEYLIFSKSHFLNP